MESTALPMFTLAPTIILDVDECTSGSGGCRDPNAVCTNTIGSYHCRGCKTGYQYNGHRCEGKLIMKSK